MASEWSKKQQALKDEIKQALMSRQVRTPGRALIANLRAKVFAKKRFDAWLGQAERAMREREAMAEKKPVEVTP